MGVSGQLTTADSDKIWYLVYTKSSFSMRAYILINFDTFINSSTYSKTMVTIKSNNFILRPIRLSDLELYFETMQDKDTKKAFLGLPITLEEAKKEIKDKINASKKKPVTGETFTIEINGKFAGFVEIHDLNKKYHEHKGIIGYCIHPNFRNKGITTKAVKLVTDYAFKKYKLKRISGWCRTFNKASARVLEKAGYTLEGILRKNKFKDGKYFDDMVWAKVK